MKNYNYSILLFLIIVNISNVKAQYNSLFGDNHTCWNIKTDQLAGPVLDSLLYVSDTIISDNLYKKCKYYRENNEWESYIFIREDNDSGKSWYFVDDETTQYLIYDMSLELGDSFYLERVGDITVDSIYTTSDGSKCIRFDYWFGSGLDRVKFTMMEGIGTNVGIVYHDAVAMGNINPVLLCQEKDGVYNYINNHPIYRENCNLNPLGINNNFENDNKVLVFPNPTKGLFKIRCDVLRKAQVYNLSGEIIFTTNNKEVNLSQQTEGIYFLKLFTKKGVIVEKIILE